LWTLATGASAGDEVLPFSNDLNTDPNASSEFYSDPSYLDLATSVFGTENSPIDNGDSMVRESISNQFSYRFKTESLGLWHDGEIIAAASAYYGVDTNELIDWSKSVDLNRLAGIDTEGNTRLNTLLYRHEFNQLKANLTFGLQDFSQSFYQLSSTSQFALAALHHGPETNIAGGTSFSNSAVGVQFNYKFDHYYVRAATYDSSSSYDPAMLTFNLQDGMFTAFEGGITGANNFKLAAGVWNHISSKERQAYLPQAQQRGYYVIAEKNYWNRASFFMQAGVSSSGLYQISDYRSAGAVIKDIFSEKDTLGVAFTKVALDNDLVTSANTPKTTAWEVTYRTPSFLTTNIETSLFYQLNPNLRMDDDSAKVLGLRFYRRMD